MIKSPLEEEFIMFKERLSLSEEQAMQVKNIFEDLMNQFRMEQRERKPLTVPQKWIEYQARKDRSIKSILTEEQKKLYDQIIKERRNRIGEQMRLLRENMIY